MMFAGPIAAPLSPSTYTCTKTACTGNLAFRTLQIELNRVRPKVGLPADVKVDGVLGGATISRLVKTAQAINAKVGGIGPDTIGARLSDYTSVDIVLALTPAMVARDVPDLIDELRYLFPMPPGAGALIDPYGDVSMTPTTPVAPRLSWMPSGPGRWAGPSAQTVSPPVPYQSQFPVIPVIAGVGVLGAVGLVLWAVLR